jgi:hypothetical protein
MKCIRIVLLITIVSVVIVSNVFGETNSIVDKLVIKKIKSIDYINSRDYISNRNKIKEELVDKLSEMVRDDKYEGLLYLIPFIVEISDNRYVKLMCTIEKNIGNIAGVNIKGYSEFIELKIKKASSDTIINRILKPSIGSYLFYDVSSLVMSRSENINNKLKYFKLMTEKVDFKYPDIIYNQLLEDLCKENMEITNRFIKSDSNLHKKLEYNCNNLDEAP